MKDWLDIIKWTFYLTLALSILGLIMLAILGQPSTPYEF